MDAYSHKDGRSVCSDKPASRETVTSRINLLAALRPYFDKEGDHYPAVSRLAFVTNTQKADSGDIAKKFIREERFCHEFLD